MFAPPKIAMGVRPRTAAIPVMRIGRRRIAAASAIASCGVLRSFFLGSFGQDAVGEIDHQHAETHHDADHHYDAHHRLNAEKGVREKEHPSHTDQPERHGKYDDERIEKRTELDDHDQINEHDREEKSEAKRLKRLVHRFHFAAHLDVIALGHLRAVSFDLVDVTLDVVSDRADIAPLHVDENVGHAGDVEMINFGVRRAARKFRNSAQCDWRQLIFTRYGDVEDRVDRLDVVLAILRTDEIMVAVFFIDPE